MIAIQLFEEVIEKIPGGYDDIGCIYLFENEIRNTTLAVKYFQKAVDKGITEGYTHLGFCYANGFGVVKDREKAKELLQVAIDQGDEEATTYYNDIIKKEGYIDTAKSIGKGILNVLGTFGGAFGNAYMNTNINDDDDDEYY